MTLFKDVGNNTSLKPTCGAEVTHFIPLVSLLQLSPFVSTYPVMSNQEAACYTIVYEDNSEAPSLQDLRNALQKGSDEVKIDTLRKIIVLTINGNAQVC
jgi:hypothetical protein